MKADHQSAIRTAQTNAASLQTNAIESTSAEWQDQRPEAIAQRQLRDEINVRMGDSQQLSAQLKQSSKPIQLFRAAAGTAEHGGNVPVTLDDDTFVKKHVAADSAAAVAKTQARIDDGNAPQSMINGTLANTLAPEADWIAAMDADATELPPANDWGPDIDYTESDSGRALNLGPITVQGWEAQGTTGAITATSRQISKYVEGTWTVENDEAESGGEEEAQSEAEASAPSVSLTIDHLTQ